MQQFRKQLPFTTREEWKNMVDISIIVFPVINRCTPLPIIVINRCTPLPIIVINRCTPLPIIVINRCTPLPIIVINRCTPLPIIVINRCTPLPIQQQVYLFCRSLVNVVIYAGLCCGIILNNEMSYPLDVVLPPRLITRII